MPQLRDRIFGRVWMSDQGTAMLKRCGLGEEVKPVEKHGNYVTRGKGSRYTSEGGLRE